RAAAGHPAGQNAPVGIYEELHARAREVLPPDVYANFATGSGDEETVAVNEAARSEEHTSELQSREKLVCRLLLEKKNVADTDYNVSLYASCATQPPSAQFYTLSLHDALPISGPRPGIRLGRMRRWASTRSCMRGPGRSCRPTSTPTSLPVPATRRRSR